MNIDIVTIFPTYFDTLNISLLGKAQHRGLMNVQVHDLRDYAHDRHRTVDDTPAGGGAGMVMKPEPWGEALDTILMSERSDGDPLIIFPSPAAKLFTQKIARELSEESHLIFACGRYEGIDQRVFDEYATRARMRLLSIGDYVLNGGEVASLAMIEAIARLLPGVVGNPESLREESHEDNGMLEYPIYTKPASWRGRHVPPVLLGGDHEAVKKWRWQKRLERTRLIRPDLLSREETEPTRGRPAAE